MADADLKCCPQCGSSAVDFSLLLAKCSGCGWEGEKAALLTVPTTGFNEGGQLLGLMSDLRKMMSNELGAPFLKFLIKWGFLEADLQDIAGTLDRQQFSRYLASIAAAILKATLETRRAIASAKGN